jgi:hypothetical protein
MGGEKHKGQRAWLVTRHWRADYPKWEVAAILSGGLGGATVRGFVELLGFTSYYTLQEQAAMQWSGPGRAPYPAQFNNLWQSEISCGDDPYLRARLVDDLMVERNADGGENVVWKERPRRQLPVPDTPHE